MEIVINENARLHVIVSDSPWKWWVTRMGLRSLCIISIRVSVFEDFGGNRDHAYETKEVDFGLL